jgi:hypothetical protein
LIIAALMISLADLYLALFQTSTTVPAPEAPTVVHFD